jgi:hypothetical protein
METLLRAPAAPCRIGTKCYISQLFQEGGGAVSVAVPPYGVVIQEAIASGDLAKMKEAAKQAEQYVREWGNIPAALEALKLEISKQEKKPYGRR